VVLPIIETRRAEIARLCRRFQVRRLDVFGSAAREDDFDPERSDVDFLVEFAEAAPPLSLAQFFELRDELARVVGRPVDLVTAGSVRNPYVSADIERFREPVYAA
jgi:predicted nucleotidyltransferase